MFERVEAALTRRVHGLRDNRFLRSVGLLAGGAAGAQLIMVAALPLLTRIYSPDDFSLLGVYTALLGTLSIVACLGYDNAIPIPESQTEAVNVMALALGFAVAIGAVLLLSVFAWPTEIGELLRQPKLVPFLWLLPAGVCLSGIYSALRFWASRQGDFQAIGRSQLVQAGGGAGAQLALGLNGFAPFGLLFGQLMNSGAGVVGLAARILRNEHELLPLITRHGMRLAFSQHDRFAKYTTPGLLASSAGVQLPIIIIAAVAIGPQAGFLLLAMRVFQGPMTLIGTAVSQVYYAEAPEAYRKGALPTLTANTLGQLAKVGIGPLICVAIAAPEAFEIAFGARWRPAGILIAWMTPWIVFQFLTAPISTALFVLGRQKLAMLMQFAGLAFRVLPVLAVARFAPNMLLEVFSVSGFAFYAMYLAVLLHLLEIPWSGFWRIVRANATVVTAFVLIGVVVKATLSCLV